MPIDWLTIGGALLAGLLGSAHCAAMCGGIATGFSSMSRAGGLIPAVEVNLGRVSGYVLAGAIAGGIGQGIVEFARQPWLTFATRSLVGVVLIIVGLRLLRGNATPGAIGRLGARFLAGLRPLQRRMMPADSRLKRLGFGMLWGWLPCGLSTTLLVAAWLQADALNGALTMAAFGLGTLPVMLPLTWSGSSLGRWLQQKQRRRLAAALVLTAGTATLAAPWLMIAMPQLHGPLAVLGCQPPPF